MGKAGRQWEGTWLSPRPTLPRVGPRPHRGLGARREGAAEPPEHRVRGTETPSWLSEPCEATDSGATSAHQHLAFPTITTWGGGDVLAHQACFYGKIFHTSPKVERMVQ